MASRPEETKKRCSCPYCDGEIGEGVFPYCTACKIEISYCPKCRQPLARDRQVCPHCGADLSGDAAKGGK